MSQLSPPSSPASGLVSTEPPIIEITAARAAYLVHLIWRDLPGWDHRRRLPRSDAEALAEQLAALLPPKRRQQLEAMRPRPEAA
jgi:hypothetical protein